MLILGLIIISLSCASEKQEPLYELADAEELGISLQSRIDKDDIRLINELFDLRSFASQFIMKSTKKRIHKFNTGVLLGLSRSFNFGELLIQQKSEAGDFGFIRAYQDEKNQFHLLFRVYGEGLNYHDYLVKTINDELKIVDAYIYMSGENLSDSYKRYYKKLLNDSNLLTSDVGNASILKDMEKLQKVERLYSERKYKKALKVYETISYNSKNTKNFKLFKIQITFHISDELYYEAIKDYEVNFKNDPSLYLVALDGLIYRKEFDKCLNYIDKLDNLLEKDPFLNFIRGNVYRLKKDNDNALGKYAIVNLEYPEFIGAYENRLDIYLETNQNSKAIEILDVFLKDFKMDKEELNFNLTQEVPNFVKSKAYKNWYFSNKNV